MDLDERVAASPVLLEAKRQNIEPKTTKIAGRPKGRVEGRAYTVLYSRKQTKTRQRKRAEMI